MQHRCSTSFGAKLCNQSVKLRFPNCGANLENPRLRGLGIQQPKPMLWRGSSPLAGPPSQFQATPVGSGRASRAALDLVFPLACSTWIVHWTCPPFASCWDCNCFTTPASRRAACRESLCPVRNEYASYERLIRLLALDQSPRPALRVAYDTAPCRRGSWIHTI